MKPFHLDPRSSSRGASARLRAAVRTLDDGQTDNILGFLYPSHAPDLFEQPVLVPPAPDNDREAGAVRSETNSPLGGWQKRALDVTVALLALTLLAPIMLFVAFLIKITLGGPVIYAHQRVSCGGRNFHCLKFRTMVRNSDEVLRQLLSTDPAAAREWRQDRKLRNDPRITPLGMLLRKSSLDELPQLINVLRGDMSCVGPRPVPADELERYGVHAQEYKKTRPGLTGLWQTSGRNLLTYDDRIALDCAYVRDWSLGRDLAILMKTVPAVMNFNETT